MMASRSSCDQVLNIVLIISRNFSLSRTLGSSFLKYWIKSYRIKYVPVFHGTIDLDRKHTKQNKNGVGVGGSNSTKSFLMLKGETLLLNVPSSSGRIDKSLTIHPFSLFVCFCFIQLRQFIFLLPENVFQTL